LPQRSPHDRNFRALQPRFTLLSLMPTTPAARFARAIERDIRSARAFTMPQLVAENFALGLISC
jgi:hypothetical protein